MNFKELNKMSIDDKFIIYHAKNPKVYEWFKEFALQAIDKKRKKTSAKLIINRIRWELYFVNEDSKDFKINDAFSSRYARLFINDFPEYSSKLELRELRS